jgi:hypothetical protein
LVIADQTPETVTVDLPTEPPIGSVVIDRDGTPRCLKDHPQRERDREQPRVATRRRRAGADVRSGG